MGIVASPLTSDHPRLDESKKNLLQVDLLVDANSAKTWYDAK